MKWFVILLSFCYFSGDIVGASICGNQLTETVASGIVVRVSREFVEVAFDNSDEQFDDTTYNLIKLANNVTYQRLQKYEPCSLCECFNDIKSLKVLFQMSDKFERSAGK